MGLVRLNPNQLGQQPVSSTLSFTRKPQDQECILPHAVSRSPSSSTEISEGIGNAVCIPQRLKILIVGTSTLQRFAKPQIPEPCPELMLLLSVLHPTGWAPPLTPLNPKPKPEYRPQFPNILIIAISYPVKESDI